MNDGAHPIILFDGVCILCNGFIQFVIKRDRLRIFRFGTLQSENAKEIVRQIGLDKVHLSTIVLIGDGIFYTESDAVLRIMRRLRGWSIAYGFIALPSIVRDAVYRFVSKRRYRIFGRRDTCLAPTPDLKDRFI